MIDEGETDWKLLAIDVQDDMADKLNDVDDIETHMPGLLAATVEWFKIYKMPDGKPPNEFAFDAKPKDKAFALEVIKTCSDQWKALMDKDMGPEGISRACTAFECSAKIGQDDANATVEAASAPGEDKGLETSVDKWHYVKL